jgi:molecular chaperone DnaJ
MPRVGGGGSRGDLIVHLSVTVPRKLNKKQRELLEALAAESGEEHAEHRSPLDKLKDWLGG